MPLYHVMPAEPGWRVVRVSEHGELSVGKAVIAWGIHTDRSQALTSTAHGITCGNEGNRDPVFGYLRPDGKVEANRGKVYETLADAQKSVVTETLRARTA